MSRGDRVDLDELRRLRRARDLMDRAYAEPLDVPALARSVAMSTAHFSRRFREAYGETPYAHLMTRRIERAQALLREDVLSVTEVCWAVGFNSLGSFSSRFTELVGESPSAYRVRDHTAVEAVPGCVAMVVGRARREPAGGGRGASGSSRNEEATAPGAVLASPS